VRIALLPFEDLTGDDSLDWMRGAGPRILQQQLAGAGRLVPAPAPTPGQAAALRAARLLHCIFTRAEAAQATAVNTTDSLRIACSIEDSRTHKIVQTVTQAGAPLAALSGLAHQLEPAARSFSSSKLDAVVAWATGDFQRAVESDPDFGAAWESWTERLIQEGKREQALAAAASALSRASLRSDLNRARLRLATANLRHDDAARAAALEALSVLVSNDPAVLDARAEVEQRRRRFSAAAALYRQAIELDPQDPAAWNGLGYAEGEAGHLDAAKSALETYGKLPEQSVNALDSLGDVYFMNGRFAEAEKVFLEALRRDPDFLSGATLNKAAYARWLRGDLASADELERRYLAHIPNGSALFREAAWLYATGRREQAFSKLAEAPKSHAEAVARYRAVWRGQAQIPQDLTQRKRMYEDADPAADGLWRVLYAEALARAGRNDEAKTLLHLWPVPVSEADPLLQSLVFPKFLDLRKRLGLS
jgi:tetratricopeptide (TPR) repeat protein